MGEHTIRVNDGKYTFRVTSPPHRGPTIAIDRYNSKDWHHQQEGFNAFHSMICELDAARVVLREARILRGACVDGGPPPHEALVLLAANIIEAMNKHDRLVGDREDPSDWCVHTPEAPEGATASPARFTREQELARRLVATGPKAAHVSASECHEIAEAVFDMSTEIERLERELAEARR